ncbi:hypothetical protein [Rubellimicrobium arenae]|uniref:hypothetical protein n=1 Tax=Rubellimicrobium arenae TaxID=2817372 RepID=UPI001B30CA9C|nr:hypothetical protein [Rubellimicrobium arenae]
MAAQGRLQRLQYFWDHLSRKRDVFLQNQEDADAAAALDYASALREFNDRLFACLPSEIRDLLGPTVDTADALWNAMELSDDRFHCLGEVATFRRPLVRLPSRRSRPAYANDVHVFYSRFGADATERRNATSEPRFAIHNAGHQMSFDDCAEALYVRWHDLLVALTGRVTWSWPYDLATAV